MTDDVGWTEVERCDQFSDVIGKERNAVWTRRLVRLPVSTQVGCHYSIAISEITDLVLPVSGTGTQSMDEKQRLAIASGVVVKSDVSQVCRGHERSLC